MFEGPDGIMEMRLGASGGVSSTVNGSEEFPEPSAFVTVIKPVAAPTGTVVDIWVSVAVNGVLTPLNKTSVVPRNWTPSMVTGVPVRPIVGVKPVMTGGETTASVNVDRPYGDSEFLADATAGLGNAKKARRMARPPYNLFPVTYYLSLQPRKKFRWLDSCR